jgi:hypothetical protein
MCFCRAFEPERLLIGVLSAAGSEEAALADRLEPLFGPVDFRRTAGDFRWTSYYDAEMGGGIRRSFLSFSRLVDPATLADIKIATNKLEAELSIGGKRRYNLDPGLLSLSRLVLATTKNRSHRIPLRDGIYAELTLVFEEGDFRGLPWTYADWRSEEYRAVLRELRSLLKRGPLAP